MIYFQFNKFKKFNHQIDFYYFNSNDNLSVPHITGKFNTSILKSSLLNNKSVVIANNSLDHIDIKEGKLMSIQENLIYLSYKIKKILPENIEFQSFSDLKDQIYKFEAKNIAI